jgi:hypothetical protein
MNELIIGRDEAVAKVNPGRCWTCKWVWIRQEGGFIVETGCDNAHIPAEEFDTSEANGWDIDRKPCSFWAEQIGTHK